MSSSTDRDDLIMWLHLKKAEYYKLCKDRHCSCLDYCRNSEATEAYLSVLDYLKETEDREKRPR